MTTMPSAFLSTIGIADVFLDPPPSWTLPKSYLEPSETPNDLPIVTHEVVGTIKLTPEDFVVREISNSKRTLPDGWKIANVRDAFQPSENLEGDVNGDEPKINKGERNVGPDLETDIFAIENKLSPLEIVRKVLEHHIPKEAENLLSALETLHQSAIVSLGNSTKDANVESKIDIPSIPHDSSCLSPNRVQAGGDRGSLHRGIKLAFPLLETKTIKKDPGNNATVQVAVDSSLFGLRTSLLNPQEDMPKLYQFRNLGCPPSTDETKPGGKKRKRSDRLNLSDSATNRDDPSKLILPLRLAVSKDERRKVHHLISKKCKDFETGTINNYAVEGSSQNEVTSALIVKWSKRAQRLSSKRPRKSMYTLCVLKKRQKEHLAAVQALTTALRCSQSDIGLAGIKDMQAITYQYCTIRNRKPEQVARGNSYLAQRGMELASFMEVDWLLNQGDLDGNQFSIVLRDIMRIQVEGGCGSTIQESPSPCEEAHIQGRVESILKHGFINFYGEQRLGPPGTTADVGVRSFDIGRAMLQQDFDEAINLLLTGRRITNDDTEESPEAVRARQVWKTTDGNAAETLKALPASMGRERIVLQGLKRYGKSLDAFKCLHYGVRHFWVNAYQSYVWNNMASARLSKYGKTVVVGDLAEGDNGDVFVVDSENIKSTQLEAVVLPLPGYKMQYPQNEVGAMYRDFLKREKVSFVKDAPLEATAKGSYRKLIVRVDDLKMDVKEANAGSVKTASFNFTLPPGSYATMMLRELMVTTTVRRTARTS